MTEHIMNPDQARARELREFVVAEFRKAGRHFTADELAADELGRTSDLAIALRAVDAFLALPEPASEDAVTQADREAAAAGFQRDNHRRLASKIESGEIDDNWLVQAFRLHRIQYLSARPGEAVEKSE